MAKEKREYGTKQLREFASRLRVVAARIENSVDIAEEQGLTELDVAAWKSGELGIKNFLAFARSLNDAVDGQLLKDPLSDPSPSESRKPVKQPKKST